MSYVTWKVEHIPFINNGWDDDDKVELSTIRDMMIMVGLGEKKDSFKFKIANFNNNFDNTINPNDKITIYRAVNTDTVTTEDTLLVGGVKDTPEEYSAKANDIRVDGYNYSETIANALAFVDVENLTIDAALKLALENAGQQNDNFKVTWNENNPSTKQDDVTAFPIVSGNARFYNKPLKHIIEKLSTNVQTQDGDYFWYVDNNNTLVWRPKTTTLTATFNSSDSTHTKLKIGKDIKGVRNYIILKGGLDPENNQIQNRYINQTSVSTNGVKYNFVASDVNNAQQLVNEDLVRDYGQTIEANSYPKFPFTSTWISAATGLQATAADEDEYVEIVRAHIKAALKIEGQIIAEAYQYGKLTVDVTFQAGVKTYPLGAVIKCTIPEVRDEDFYLRVSEIQYTTTTDTFTLTEDTGTLGQGS